MNRTYFYVIFTNQNSCINRSCNTRPKFCSTCLFVLLVVVVTVVGGGSVFNCGGRGCCGVGDAGCACGCVCGGYDGVHGGCVFDGGGGGNDTKIILSLSIRYHVTKKTDSFFLGGAVPSVTWHFFAATAISRQVYLEVR